MDKVSKHKIHSVSVTIRWCEEAVATDGEHCSLELNIAARNSQDATEAVGRKLPHGVTETGARSRGKRLLPSDRIVLDALRQRIPKGEQVTTMVRTRDLEAECELSRRQVQICVKRLKERGLIKRLIEGTDSGSTGGYRYQLSKDVLGNHVGAKTGDRP